MWFRIIPNDTLFFRDGRPFTMGAESWAEVIFPPNPSTLYGAIRSWLIFEKGDLRSFREGKLKDELGTPEEKGTLKIMGPLLMSEDEVLFPVPLDLVKDKKGNLHKLSILERPTIFISDYRMKNFLVWKEAEKVEEAEGYLGVTELKDYLLGRRKMSFIKKEEVYTLEPKIGIARDDITKTTKEGHLYRIPMVRLRKDVSIVVSIEGVNDIPQSGALQFGGENRTIRIEVKTEDNTLKDIEKINLSLPDRRFKIYLATPALFEKGYLPKWIDEDSLEGTYEGVNLKLVCCAIGRYKLIGGWDMAKNKPKPMLRAVPEGSVYYFQILDDSDFSRVKDIFHCKNISDVYPEEGYGLSFIGR